VIPSGLVATTVPPFTTAQKIPRSGDQVNDCQFEDEGRVLWIHVIPSGLVAAIAELVAKAQKIPS